jgi:hypothetical protein
LQQHRQVVQTGGGIVMVRSQCSSRTAYPLLFNAWNEANRERGEQKPRH